MTNYFDTMASEWDDDPKKVSRANETAKQIKEIQFNSYNSVVDFGSGTGLLGMNLIDLFSHVHLVDSSRNMLEVASRKIKEANINNVTTQQSGRLSELTSKHSAIVTLMTLHHITGLAEFFSDAYSVLEDNGTLIICDLYKEDGAFHQHDPSFDGHNGFDISDLSSVAENNGFAVRRVEQYYEIWKADYEGVEVPYPLFLFVATKEQIK